MSSISLFDIINVVLTEPNTLGSLDPEPKTFSLISASAGDDVGVNLNGMITLFESYVSKTFINGKPILINGPGILSKNPLYCIILEISVSNHLVSGNELFVETLRSLTTCLSFIEHLCSNYNLRVTYVALLSLVLIYEVADLIVFHFHRYIESFYTKTIVKRN